MHLYIDTPVVDKMAALFVNFGETRHLTEITFFSFADEKLRNFISIKFRNFEGGDGSYIILLYLSGAKVSFIP